MDNSLKLVNLEQLEAELRMVEQTIEKLTNKKVNLLTQIHNIKNKNMGASLIEVRGYGSSMNEAYKSAVEDAIYEHGNDSL
jgi:uncharacterized protein YeeX (DUF496 family)